jgi:hypothetical protein
MVDEGLMQGALLRQNGDIDPYLSILSLSIGLSEYDICLFIERFPLSVLETWDN